MSKNPGRVKHERARPGATRWSGADPSGPGQAKQKRTSQYSRVFRKRSVPQEETGFLNWSYIRYPPVYVRFMRGWGRGEEERTTHQGWLTPAAPN